MYIWCMSVKIFSLQGWETSWTPETWLLISGGLMKGIGLKVLILVSSVSLLSCHSIREDRQPCNKRIERLDYVNLTMNSTYSVQNNFCFLTFYAHYLFFYFQNRSITDTFKAAVVLQGIWYMSYCKRLSRGMSVC